MSSNGQVRDFSTFYREYARGGVHAASAAAMTAFGLLTIYHEAFAVLALLSYVVPALYVYAERNNGDERESDAEVARSAGTDRSDASTAETSSASVEEDERSERRKDDSQREQRKQGEQSERGGRSERDGPRPSTPDDVEIDASSADVAANAGSADDEGTVDPEDWVSVDSPVNVDLSDVVAAGGGAYAVGEDGYVLVRTDDGWATVLEDGPGADGENLTGVDVSDDGRAVWLAGDGGALGRIDTASDRHTDHSAPGGDTSTVTAVAVVGDAGAETVVLANGSGEVRRGEYDGERVRWGEPVKPGSGSSIAAVSFADAERGYLADTNGSVFRTTDGGETYDVLGIGDAGTLTAVAPVVGEESAANAEAFVTEDDGTIRRYDGAQWTPVRPTEEGLWAIAVEPRTDRVVAVAVGEHGTVLERDGGDWKRRETSPDETLRGVGVAADRRVAVGDDGTILERRRAHRPTE
ncbi:sialidase family protein [Haloprofundus halobius]|uniref:sialidase family protein n=1 Tax=Haloprofundus halobius TaxID=2876194 RepID=UPI001CCFAAA6|nr:hypothetical protein [Haloprofundus halobius]